MTSACVLVAVELVLVSAEWFAWIWITINIQMKDVLLSPDLMLWRTATHSPALVHKWCTACRIPVVMKAPCVDLCLIPKMQPQFTDQAIHTPQ